MYDLKNKVVLITGAARGIGAALCAEVLKEGAKHVRIFDVNVNAGTELQDDLNDKYGENKAKFVKVDVTDMDQFFKAITDTKEENGYLDILVNNAGVVIEGNFAEIRKQIEINFIAVVNGTLKALELMDKSKGGKGGAVLNVASTAALYPSETPTFVYSATKAAVLQFSDCLGKDPFYSETGVRIISLCYGVTDTPIMGTINCFRSSNQDANTYIGEYMSQSAETAAKGAVEAFKKGKSASNWLIKDGKPAVDITAERKKFHDYAEKTMCETLIKKL